MALFSVVLLIFNVVAIPNRSEAALAGSCNCVIFRIDDIQDYWINSVQVALMDQFINRNVNATFGIIMNFVGNDPLVVSKVREGHSSNLFELDLHGWNHVDYSQLSLQDQKNTLEMANQKLQDIWGRKSNIFIPPYNAYNVNTLNATSQLGLKIISSEFDQELPSIYDPDNPNSPNNKIYKAATGFDIKDQFGVYHLPQEVGFYTYDSEPPTKTPLSLIESRIDDAIASYGYVVITLHPQDFAVKNAQGVPSNAADQNELNDLNTLIDYAQGKQYKITTFSSVTKIPLPPIIDNVPPKVTPPADIALVTPDNPATVNSLGTATATDNIDLNPTITNNATSNLFPRGTTAVKWSATDDNNNVGTAIQYVTISPTNDAIRPAVKTTSPSAGAAISGPAAGVNILVTGTASDGQSGVKVVEVRTSTTAYQKATQTNGSSWANWYYILNIKTQGSTTVVSRATDFFANQQWDSTPISVSLAGPDITAPTITAPPSMTIEATGELTPVSLGKPFVFDNSDPSPNVTNDSPGASEATGFPLGTTTVTWTATDVSGNSASSNQAINVVDTTAPPAPQLLAPANGTVTNSPSTLSLDWSNETDIVSSSVTYDLLVDDNLDFSSPVVNQQGLTESSYAVSEALGDATYYWKVRSSDASSNKSPYSSVRSFIVDGLGPTVTASPPGGTYTVAQSVTLTASEPSSSTIYYTTDGSTPSTNSTVYTGPIAISSSTTLKFFARDTAGNNGATGTEVYVIDAAAPTVTATPQGGLYNSAQSVTLAASEPGFTIYYTTDGTTPNENSTVYAGPILISSNTDLKFFGKDGIGRTTPIVSETYTFDTTPPTVTASPPGGLYNTAQSVTLTASESSTIYYTTDGQTPTTFSPVYSSPIQISSNTDLKFFAKDTAGNEGLVVVETYVIDTVPPSVTASPPGGVYNASQSVTLTASKPGSTIYYTTDGSTPSTNSTVYSAPIPIIGQGTTTVLKFFAKDSIGNVGVVTTETYTISASSFPITHMSDTTATSGLSLYAGQQAHAEFVSPASQLVGKSIDQITLKLRKTNSPTGTAEVGVFNPDLTVKKLFGTKDAATLTSTYTDYTFSLSGLDLYTIQSGDRIGIKYAGGNSNNYMAVMLDRDAADPFDGTNTYRQQYTTSWLSFTSDDMYMILKQTHDATDTIAPTVTATPVGGTYTAAVSVTLAANEPATIYYTLDGSTPTTSSSVYTSPIQIASSTVLKFFGRDTAGNDSAPSTETYTINIPSFPVTQMSDTTATSGLSTYSAQQAHAEFVSPTSQLAGKSIDEITLKLRKTGTPTGTAEIGIFNPDLTVKKLFGTKDATTITTTYTDYTFSLSNGELYTLQSGDRIGIKYTSGSSTNFIAVMLDRDAADPFDGTNTYRQQYTTSWTSNTADDMYMILKQTHG
ncbi:putative xylanase/chitin deacetylase [Candidatus Nitrososphaera evergladensis SR1]|uniref:Putative xylanase/chitin deacetylase n=1 Tax=Candidatus Nitrososphaera evergladensis SR1 TaxID=1459636 RepID=A0A075MW84_9ARCH|nr:chitobiase/beta-hexosaminidase C-terminal domain-containing protein [Candidatus Nitrososphaera evergladensis]AIF83549.1 putative xylanase/chitin deacetylase [Candidatus Nitrososphaera evergladensis SR1]